MTDPIYLLALLFAAAAVAEWLGGLPTGRRFGGAIIMLVLGILLSNVGLMPTASNAPPLYDWLIAVGAPVAIFLLLLDVRLRALRRAGLVILVPLLHTLHRTTPDPAVHDAPEIEDRARPASAGSLISWRWRSEASGSRNDCQQRRRNQARGFRPSSS